MPQTEDKLITLHVDLGKEWRGGQSQALLLMKGLRGRGHVAELVALRDSPLARRAEAEGIRVHAVSPPLARAKAARIISAVLRETRAHMVHTHEAHALTAAWLACAHKQARVAASRRVALPLGRSALALSRYRSASRVLAVSKFVAESVVSSGIKREQVAVVHDGVEIPLPISDSVRAKARERWCVSTEQRLFGCVGYLLPEKGQELLIRAWPAVRKKSTQCKLILAGDGPLRSRLESLAKKLGVAESVYFAGLVDNVAEVYAALDAFLFPSHAEPLGSSMLTAMAYGLATVAQRRGAVPEVITDGQNGLLIDGPNAGEFSAAILRLIHEPDLAGRLGTAARQTIEAQFSATHMVEGTLHVYREVLTERSDS
ncbi:MAG TPA: glycosyltransferase family 4 protein [Terriglobia bacterium]|nr:glycosyltransferase family 4 protein [Terriglobia bacterium]